ncbi:PAS domain-containing protein [Microbispora triticiradicis]|uniref:histidine kinase n=3 Tax=Microbispora TaxID=2005 RepID=A0ABY3M1R7_9ACTN|nr:MULTISPECIES: ATP-binding protein [Microbispora]RGA01981.1 PAS domain-containing protein [Microbispora triticiradicis]TLP64140.1 PAS domain-containing protein [Microbispora fusca]TYB64118.1 PAS domain-containing protein [Microbispora tritici]GLW19973.1 PAS domain-containing sensor histidine kinase [Microbispora amethystogenes]
MRGDDTPGGTPEGDAGGRARIDADDLPDGLVATDPDGVILMVNRAAERLTGVTRRAAVGRLIGDVLPLRDQDGRDWWKWLDPHGGLRTRSRQPERPLHLPGRQELLVAARFVREPARGGEVERVVITLRDASARARVERSRADLVSTVAHELRSPLTSVKGFTATLLAKWERLTDAQKLVMLETVNADADRVTRLITELLDVSRIESGRVEIHRQVVDVPARARRIIAGRVAAGEPEDRFRLEVLGELPETWLDQDKIDQVLGNLVENAVRHGRGTVTIVVEPVEWGVAVSVRDQGEGVAPELVDRVFRQFWRGNGRRRGGTGLGLFIVKGLVEAHGGTISVQRAPGGGAEFRFTLPTGTPDFA